MIDRTQTPVLAAFLPPESNSPSGAMAQDHAAWGGEIQRRLTADIVFNQILGGSLEYRSCSGSLAVAAQVECTVGEETGRDSQIIVHIEQVQPPDTSPSAIPARCSQ